jgi:hypothetical protein
VLWGKRFRWCRERLFGSVHVVMTTGRESPALLAFSDVVDAFCSRDRATDSARDLPSELCLKRTLINRLELDFAHDAAAFSATYSPEVHINPTAVSWLRQACHLTVHAAATAIAVGEQAGRLVKSSAAIAAGQLGWTHLGLMARTVKAVDASGSTVRFDEERLLHKAALLSVRAFRRVCQHVRHQADRDAFLAEQLEEREWRSLEVTDCEDGGVSLSGYLDAEGGAILRTALEPLSRRAGADDGRRPAQRTADALVELCSHALDTGVVPQRASQRAHVQVTTTLETLQDLAGAPAGDMEFAGVLAGTTVQRVACDSTITRVLVTPESRVIDVGRSERVVPGSTRRALNIRDQGCRWPGCDRPPSWTAAHHVVHWANGGTTDQDNLVLLCRRHHWAVHEGGWQLVRADDGAILTVAPVSGTMPPFRAPLPRALGGVRSSVPHAPPAAPRIPLPHPGARDPAP